MGRRNDPDRIRAAKLTGTVQRLRHLLVTHPDEVEELRRVWPELAERIDDVVELVDWDRQPPG